MAEGILYDDKIINAGKNYSIQSDNLANRPVAGTADRWFLALDTKALYYDNGTTWVLILTGGGGTLTSADNGLSLSGTVAELGGPLIKNTDIVPAGSLFSVNGSFAASNGMLYVSPATSVIGVVDNAGLRSYVLVTSLGAGVTIGGTLNAFQVDSLRAVFTDATNVYGIISRAALTFVKLANANPLLFLQADASGSITNVALPAAAVGGVNNGLSLSGSTAQLGGTLIQNTTIGLAFSLFLNGALARSTISDALTKFQIADGGGTLFGGISIVQNLVELFANSAASNFRLTSTQLTLLDASAVVYALITAASVKFVPLANADATKFLQADAAGTITSQSLPAAAVGSANNGLTVTSAVVQLGGPLVKDTTVDLGGFNMQFTQTQTNTNTPIAAAVGVNTYNFSAGVSPATGYAYAAAVAFATMNLNANETFPNTVVEAAAYANLILNSTTSAAVVISPAAGGGRKVMAGVLSLISLPSVAGGVVTSIDHVAAFSSLLFQTAAAANSVRLTNFYGFFAPASDDSLPFAAITNKWGFYQEGANDINLFKGPVRLTATAIATSDVTKFVQADTSGNLTSVAAFTEFPEAAYTGTIVWTGGAAPSGSTNHTYQAHQTGKQVFLQIHLVYSVAGTADTAVVVDLPAGLPTPKQPAGLTANNNLVTRGGGFVGSSLSTTAGSGANPGLYFDGTKWVISSGTITAVVISAYTTAEASNNVSCVLVSLKFDAAEFANSSTRFCTMLIPPNNVPPPSAI